MPPPSKNKAPTPAFGKAANNITLIKNDVSWSNAQRSHAGPMTPGMRRDALKALADAPFGFLSCCNGCGSELPEQHEGTTSATHQSKDRGKRSQPR